jgi:uncharacterized protein (DUF4415 family)
MRRSGNRASEFGSTWSERTDETRVGAAPEDELDRQRTVAPDTAPEFTEDMMAEAEWVMPAKKVPVCLRMEPDVLEFFRSQGPGYQCRMNAVLRSYVTRARGRDQEAQTPSSEAIRGVETAPPLRVSRASGT